MYKLHNKYIDKASSVAEATDVKYGASVNKLMHQYKYYSHLKTLFNIVEALLKKLLNFELMSVLYDDVQMDH